MAFKIGTTAVIDDTRKLTNLASSNTAIHDMDSWTKGSQATRGGSGSWGAGTQNLRTLGVQPTTNHFAEAILVLDCYLCTTSPPNWSGSIKLQLGNSRNMIIDDAAVKIKINSRVMVYFKNTGVGNTKTTAATYPQTFLESWQTYDADTNSGGTWIYPKRGAPYGNQNSGFGSRMLTPLNSLLLGNFDYSTGTITLTWPAATTTTLGWRTNMFWR